MADAEVFDLNYPTVSKQVGKYLLSDVIPKTKSIISIYCIDYKTIQGFFIWIHKQSSIMILITKDYG